ncbi:hypothetical protein TIFTF001_023123 [Ficus carica]|uniref:Uncharacterized protein n=1 Tax=Ficus carica TaxID=3494 RepID=A0AA88AZW5_FICCA|nr:hypothetical protein TIFTF001_023123 [Ficus carica]
MPRLVQVTAEQAQISEEDATKACDLNSGDRDSEGTQVLAIVRLFIEAVIARLCSLSPLASIAPIFSLISNFSCFGHETRDRSILSLSSPAFAALIDSPNSDLTCSRSLNSEPLRSTFPRPRLRLGEVPPNVCRPHP